MRCVVVNTSQAIRRMPWQFHASLCFGSRNTRKHHGMSTVPCFLEFKTFCMGKLVCTCYHIYYCFWLLVCLPKTPTQPWWDSTNRLQRLFYVLVPCRQEFHRLNIKSESNQLPRRKQTHTAKALCMFFLYSFLVLQAFIAELFIATGLAPQKVVCLLIDEIKQAQKRRTDLGFSWS